MTRFLAHTQNFEQLEKFCCPIDSHLIGWTTQMLKSIIIFDDPTEISATHTSPAKRLQVREKLGTVTKE
jgi:hypothetical protein